MPKDFGLIRAGANGRWKWPFKDMEEGDFFKVVPQECSIERVRNAAKNYRKQGRRFSVRMDEDLIRVERTSTLMALASAMPETTSYGDFLKRMKRLTRDRFEENVPWPDEGGRIEIHIDRFAVLPPVKDMVVQVAQHRYHVHFAWTSIIIEKVRPDMTQAELIEQIELMS